MLSQIGLDFSSDSDVEAEPSQQGRSQGGSAAPRGAPPQQALLEEDGAGPDKSQLVDHPEDPTRQAALAHRFTFWFMQRPAKTASAAQDNFESSLRQIASFQTVEHFWRIYDHLARAPSLPPSTDLHVFKQGIKPTWEDPQNQNGGKFVIRLAKGLAARYWEELLLGVIGEQFDSSDICGAVLSIRYSEDIISLWNRNAKNSESNASIRDALRRVLRLPAYIQMDYKPHERSMTDKSSFRNTTAWRGSGASGVGRAPGSLAGRAGALAPGEGTEARSGAGASHTDGVGSWSRSRHQGGHPGSNTPPRDINARWR